ncbi:MAG: PEP-CTERM sorting domain-containing protein [Pirellulaceae bacterium]
MTQKSTELDSNNSRSMIPAMAAFGAVTVTGMVACSDLEADIVYSGPLNQVINAGSGPFFNFDGDSYDDIRLAVLNSSFAGVGLNGAVIFAPQGSNLYAQKFDFGDLISSGVADVGLGVMGFYNSGIYSDPWGALQAGIDGNGPVTGFMGIRMGPNSGDAYGWIQLSLQANSFGQPTSMTVVDWAYENSGAPILAGDIGAVPEPGTAGILALGALAAGAVGIRRRRTEQQSAE